MKIFILAEWLITDITNIAGLQKENMCLKCDFSFKKKPKSDYKFLTYVEYMNDFNQPQITHFSSHQYVINILF